MTEGRGTATSLDSVDGDYPVILCDLWGCVHDGFTLYPSARARLERWRAQGHRTILITNAPRTAEAITDHLVRLGLDPSLWDGIASGGDAGIVGLRKAQRPVGFIGTPRDKAILEGAGVRIADGNDFDELACSGLDLERDSVDEYEAQLRRLADKSVVMHCLNPDRVVIHGGEAIPCAGALADLYLDLGGRVEWYGKPYPAIYAHAMEMAGKPDPGAVLAIGDGLVTDMLGGARQGYACAYVTGGISQGRSIPADFAQEHGLGDWAPVAIVEGIG